MNNGIGQHPNDKERLRPQYHYFYGSTDDTDHNGDSDNHDENAHNSEQETLIGESLVPTDAEDEQTETEYDDLQHVFITNGVGPGQQPLRESGRHSASLNGSKRPGSWSDELDNGEQKGWKNSLASIGTSHPGLHVFFLVCVMSCSMLVFAILLFPTSKGSPAVLPNQGSANVSDRGDFSIQYNVIDRAEFGESLENIVQKDLFADNLQATKDQHPKELIFPLPTGAFWINLILPPTADRGLSYPVAVYPYSYKWSDSLLVLSYPALHRKVDPISIHDYFFPDLTFGSKEQITKRAITNFDPLSVTLRWNTDTNDGDEVETNKGKGTWETYLVQGSPYSTIKYDNVTPTIRALSLFKNVVCPRDEFGNLDFADLTENVSGEGNGDARRNLVYGVCSASTDGDNYKKTLRGVQFVLQTQEGVNWIVFTSEPVNLVFDTRIKTTVEFSAAFSGVLRLAVVPQSDETSLSSSTGLRRIIYHAGVYPTGGDVSWDFHDPTSVSEPTTGFALGKITNGIMVNTMPKTIKKIINSNLNRMASVHFKYTTKISNDNISRPNGSGRTDGLLMLALPHHVDALSSASNALSNTTFDLDYKCIKGPMTPILGATWSYTEPLLSVGFDGRTRADDLPIFENSRVQDTLLENLETDIRLAMPVQTENVYGYGKQVARLAQLAHIASVLNRTQSDTSLNQRIVRIQQTASEKLTYYLELFLKCEVSDHLVYDASLGGMISIDGLRNHEADFGNGRYNDHHFHYGYMLYASAVMGRLNSTFVDKYKEHVDAIFFDIAYNSNMKSKQFEGLYFPFARMISWFDGHSFASGLFPFGNGKSQESSSEAVNAYYGAYLWSVVRHGAAWDPASDVSETTDFTRLLLAMEVRAAKTYWHMRPSTPPSEKETNQTSSVPRRRGPPPYPDEFAKNYMVGNLGMLDAVCSTWFGTEKLYIHMINFIPVTGITRSLFTKDYVKDEYNSVFSAHPEVEMPWRGFVVSDHAIIDPSAAWEEAQGLFSPELDSGLSKTQVLYFILCDDSFDVSIIGNETSSGATHEDGGSALCRNNPVCASAGLTGDCCPSSNGNFLGCCQQQISPSGSSGKDSASGGSGSCASHPKCASASLVGDCCPTPDGLFLGCCEEGGSAASQTSNETASGAGGSNAEETDSEASASCSSNPVCAEAGLEGDCCPTANGSFLGCCQQQAGPNSSDQTSNGIASGGGNVDDGNNKNSDSALCENNSGCAGLNLNGFCCPSPDGTFLGCCGQRRSLRTQV